MGLFYKWLITLLCAIVLNCFVVLKTTHVSAQVELDQLSCPIMMVIGVLKNDHNLVEFLLEYGADPNASLKNCQVVVTTTGVSLFGYKVIVLLKEDQRFIDTWKVPLGLRRFILSELRNGIPDNSSLLHIAERIRPSRGQWNTRDSQVYDLLVQHGAE